MKQRAIRIVVDFVRSKLDACPIAEQIQIYEALSQVMPTKHERNGARRIAWMLQAAAKLQTDFTGQLFKEIQWPGHQHDGNGRKGGRS